MRDDLRTVLEAQGFRVEKAAVAPSAVDELTSAIGDGVFGDGSGRRGSSVFGVRNLLSSVPAVRRLAASPEIRVLVEPVLGVSAFAVRGLFFDKTREANWQLRWHQDRAIAVKERHDLPGFSPWSVKAGVHHVFPPAEVLSEMLTASPPSRRLRPVPRLAPSAPGSHRHALLAREELRRLVERHQPVVCEAGPGDVLVMRPL